MNHPQNETAVMDSWRRCAQAGLPPDVGETLYPLPPQALRELVEKHHPAISAFERCAFPTAASLPKASAFLLMDEHGILLKKMPDLPPFRMFEPGFCFAETHAGTNAAALPSTPRNRLGRLRGRTTAPF